MARITTPTSHQLTDGAHFSPDRRWRHRLWRRWSEHPPVVFVGLNPSTADAQHNDPTIRRMIGFARRDGFGGIEVVNLFDYCATDPAGLWTAPPAQRRSPGWRDHLKTACADASVAIVCWGSSKATNRARQQSLQHAETQTLQWLRKHPVNLQCFGKTARGHPRHPLYLSKNAPLVTWQ